MSLTLDHFLKAARDIADRGDNDTLPFDIDNRFISENINSLASVAHQFAQELEAGNAKTAVAQTNALNVFCERLLVPSGPFGFRTTTKLHPFWNLYFNGLGVAIAEANEPRRSERAHAYRFSPDPNRIFDQDWTWKRFREASITDCALVGENSVVVQTDIASFYEHAYHHRIENCIADLFPQGSTIAAQIDRFLSKFASGRSFGLPIGSQCSRVLAELLLSGVDQLLTDNQVVWRRYVDDFVLVASDHASAYRALSTLSHALADYGLTLNRTKTLLMSGKHYSDYVKMQIEGPNDNAAKLKQIDLYFDPYSDTAETDYNELKVTVEALQVQSLLDLELKKGQPDSFTIVQIGRTLKLHSPEVALQLCTTLLDAQNLHAFRGSWSTIMRGVASIRSAPAFETIFGALDQLLDAIPTHSPHLVLAEGSCLHYLRTLRFSRSIARANYVYTTFTTTHLETVRRGCMDCWRHWVDRPRFTANRNRWANMSSGEQRMLWVTAGKMGDEGRHFRNQVRHGLHSWDLGIERQGRQTYKEIFLAWAEVEAQENGT